MKLNIFTHMQPVRYKKALYRHSDKFITEKKVQDKRQALTYQELRMSTIDKYENYAQV